MSDPNRPAVSIVVPTYREAPNLRPLIERVFAATRRHGIEAELIIVDDDSRDGSVDVVNDLRAEYPVRIIVREGERGLGTAVLRGLAAATHDILLVMDADLSHPPEAIPALVDAIVTGHADFVIGSRYVYGGHATEWPWFRRLNSWVATALARPLTPVRDPMAGFFALPRSTLDRASELNPIGYKIGLELMVKARCRRYVEVPIEFTDRVAGTSKLNVPEQLRYLRHLAHLYWFRLTSGGSS